MQNRGSQEYPEALATLVAALMRLPGIGRRTAERLALALLEWPDETLADLGDRIRRLKTDIRPCRQCGNLSEGGLCRVCADPRRDTHQVCVVEEAVQIPVIERAGCFRGLYHVLGGRLTPLEGKGPQDLRIELLRQRLAAGDVTELIIATSSDVEGEATAAYLCEEFGRLPGVTLSRIAAGVPVGSDLSFADPATIAMALKSRHPMKTAGR